MKKQFGTSRFAVAVLVMIGALTIASTASAKNPKQVKMEMVNNKLEIMTEVGTNDCPDNNGNGKGCIKVKHGKKSKIYFYLEGDRTCKQEPGNKWELNAVYLGGYNSASKPGDDEFGFDATNDADYKIVNSDFNIADKTTGRVTPIKKSAIKLGINNKNQNPYVIWYKIEAICQRVNGGDPRIAIFDPRVRNGGNL